jgi:hypothetical protein
MRAKAAINASSPLLAPTRGREVRPTFAAEPSEPTIGGLLTKKLAREKVIREKPRKSLGRFRSENSSESEIERENSSLFDDMHLWEGIKDLALGNMKSERDLATKEICASERI